MTHARWLIGPLTIALAGGCGASTGPETQDGGGGADVSLRPAIVLNECGPADGPAYVLRVAPTMPTCGAVSLPGDFEEIHVWTALPSAPATVTITSTSGGARMCRGTTCTTASGASITFTAISATSASGTYRLDFPGSPSAVGSFTATRCNNPTFCG